MKRLLAVLLGLALVFVTVGPGLAANDHPITLAAKAGGTRLLNIQNPDGGFPWYIPGKTAVNTIGVTALGLLGAHTRTQDDAYLAGAVKAAALLTSRYNAAPTKRPYANDVQFLVELSKKTDNDAYATLARTWFANIPADYPVADSLVTYALGFRGRYRSMAAWDIAGRIVAAKAVGNVAYATQLATSIVAREAQWKDTDPSHVWGGGPPGNIWSYDYTILGTGALLAAFKSLDGFESKIKEYRSFLLSVQEADGSWDIGDTQMTSYVVLGLDAVGGPGAREASGKGAQFLMSMQKANGGFMLYDGGYEVGEVDGEAVYALSKVTGVFPAKGKSKEAKGTRPAAAIAVDD